MIKSIRRGFAALTIATIIIVSGASMASAATGGAMQAPDIVAKALPTRPATCGDATAMKAYDSALVADIKRAEAELSDPMNEPFFVDLRKKVDELKRARLAQTPFCKAAAAAPSSVMPGILSASLPSEPNLDNPADVKAFFAQVAAHRARLAAISAPDRAKWTTEFSDANYELDELEGWIRAKCAEKAAAAKKVGQSRR